MSADFTLTILNMDITILCDTTGSTPALESGLRPARVPLAAEQVAETFCILTSPVVSLSLSLHV